MANAAAVKANGADAATAKKTAATAVVANAAAVKANGADAAIAATAIAAVAMDADTAEAIAATDASGKTTVEANEPSFADANEQNLETLEKVMVATDRSIDSAPMAGTINANGISRIAFYKSGSQYLVDAVLSPAMPLGVASRGNVETRDLTGVHFRFSNLADAASAYVMLKAFAKDSLSASYINFETQDCSPLTASGNPISCEVEGGTSGAFRVYETIR